MTAEARDQEQKRAAQAELAAKYRKIGPAAILAALICKAREQDGRKENSAQRAA